MKEKFEISELTAIIPVREGSRRLKNKNVAPFAGTNLLINKINQLKCCITLQKIPILLVLVFLKQDEILEKIRGNEKCCTAKKREECCAVKSIIEWL